MKRAHRVLPEPLSQSPESCSRTVHVGHFGVSLYWPKHPRMLASAGSAPLPFLFVNDTLHLRSVTLESQAVPAQSSHKSAFECGEPHDLPIATQEEHLR